MTADWPTRWHRSPPDLRVRRGSAGSATWRRTRPTGWASCCAAARSSATSSRSTGVPRSSTTRSWSPQVLKDRDGRFEISENFLQQRLSTAAVDDIFRTRSLLNPGLRPSAVGGVADRRWVIWCDTGSRRASAAGDDFDPLPGARGRHLQRRRHPLLRRRRPRPARADRGPARRPGQGDRQPVGAPGGRPHADAAADPPTPPRLYGAGWSTCCACGTRRRLRHDDLATQVLAGRPAGEPLTRIADLLIGSLLAAQRVPAAGAGWLLMLVAERPRVAGAGRPGRGGGAGGRGRGAAALPADLDHHASGDATGGARGLPVRGRPPVPDQSLRAAPGPAGLPGSRGVPPRAMARAGSGGPARLPALRARPASLPRGEPGDGRPDRACCARSSSSGRWSWRRRR